MTVKISTQMTEFYYKNEEEKRLVEEIILKLMTPRDSRIAWVENCILYDDDYATMYRVLCEVCHNNLMEVFCCGQSTRKDG